jgi:Leucine-rich repeat (LRR) protein
MLDCSYNSLTSLPALPASLTWLDCKYNQLASLPALPSSLAYLDCNNNQLTALPDLPSSLAWLDCNNNLLTSLPDLPASLEELRCVENQLASLPATLQSTSLTQLYCNNNQLTSLPDLPASLTYLDCYNNRLTSLPDLPSSLAYLACFNNQLASLPSLPASLEMLDCYNNQLALLPALPASLIELYCSENQLTSLPALPASLTWLYCYDNQIASLPALPTSLAILYCNDNQLASLDLSGLTSLTTFNGSGQTVPLTLTGNVTDGYTLNIALNTPTFGNAAVTYTGGTLTSTDNTVASTSFTVQTGNASYALSGTLNLTYQDAAPAVAPAITTTSLSGGTVGTAYSRTLAATGDAPITWSITVGNLPGGLSLNASTGEISGTPTAANTFNFTVRATNGAGNDTKALSIAVIPAFVAVTNITNVPTSATAGTPLTLTGTVSPANATNQTITWSVKTAGTTGATVSGSALNTTAAGTVVVTATIANGLTVSADYTQDFTITVNKSTFTATVIMNGWVYGETANNPGVSNNPGNATVAYYYDTNIHGSFTSTVKPTDAGIYYVKAVIAESANYQGYTTQPDDFVISVAHLNVAWGSTGFTYNGTSQSPFAYVTLANHTTIYLDVTGGAVDAGTYTATASTSNPNIVPTGNTSTTYTISPAEQTISIDFSRLNHNPTRLDIINPLRATSPSGLPVQFRLRPEDAAIAEIDANNNLIFKQNGTVIVTATAPGNNNYLPASPVEITFVMNDRTGNESIELKAVTIYPNPITSGLLYIKNAKPGAKIEIYTLSGSLAGIYTATDTITTIDFSRFTSGTYIIKTGQTTLKVIKK